MILRSEARHELLRIHMMNYSHRADCVTPFWPGIHSARSLPFYPPTLRFYGRITSIHEVSLVQTAAMPVVKGGVW